jgi:hypothetical protein
MVTPDRPSCLISDVSEADRSNSQAHSPALSQDLAPIRAAEVGDKRWNLTLPYFDVGA